MPEELCAAMPQPGSAGTLRGEHHRNRSQSPRPTLPCPPSAAAAGLGAAGNSLWVHRGTHTQLEMQKGHILPSGSAEHGHSYQQPWLESTIRAGASPSSAPAGQAVGRRRAEGPVAAPRAQGSSGEREQQSSVPN